MMKTFKKPALSYEIVKRYIEWQAAYSPKIEKLRRAKLEKSISSEGLDLNATLAILEGTPS